MEFLKKHKTASILFTCVITVFLILFFNNIFIFDHSAKIGFEESIIWKNQTYYQCYSGKCEKGRYLASIGLSPLSHKLYAVKGDQNHDFLYVSGIGLYIKKDLKIDKSGQITTAYMNGIRVDNTEFLTILSDINNISNEELNLRISQNNIYNFSNQCNSIFVGFNGCPAASVYIGSLVKYEGDWLFVKEDLGKNSDSSDNINDDNYFYFCKLDKETALAIEKFYN